MKIKKCPFCEWEISSSAKKCKHCGEWLKWSNYENWEISSKSSNKATKVKATKKTTKRTKKTDNWFNRSKILKFISDNLVLVIVWVIIVFLVLKSLLKSESNQWNNIEYDIDESTEITGNTKENETKFRVKWENIKATNYGYILFPNKIWECEIRWEDIKDFVTAVKNTPDWEIIKKVDAKDENWTCPNQNNWDLDITNWKNIAILFDNSYSKDQNGDIDKSWPNKRMASLKNYFNENYLPNGSTIDIVFMFTAMPNDNSEEPDGNINKFKIDFSAFPIKYIKDSWGDDIWYLDKRNFLIFENTNISYTFSWIEDNDIKCMNDTWNNEYICYDAESVYQKIQAIYSQIYDKDGKHTNNLFIKTLSMNKDRFSGFDKDEVLIFTSWEFKTWEEYEKEHLTKLKQKYKNQWGHDQWVDKTHNLAEFNMRYANRYQKDSKYESFWTEAIEALRPKIPVCEWVKINVIWLTRSAEFKPLAEKIYKQIFEPCEVIFK